MEIRITYVGTLNGVHGLWCGFKPEGVEVSEERPILYPAKGYKLQNKDGKLLNSVWLKDGDSQDNYTEVEAPKKEKGEKE